MTHSERMRKHPTYETVPGYWQRHEDALRYTTVTARPALERAMALMLAGWAMYADAHADEYESGIGEDGVLGPDWEAIGKALRGLLNGHLGRLDAGAIDSALLGSLQAEGFKED